MTSCSFRLVSHVDPDGFEVRTPKATLAVPGRDRGEETQLGPTYDRAASHIEQRRSLPKREGFVLLLSVTHIDPVTQIGPALAFLGRPPMFDM